MKRLLIVSLISIPILTRESSSQNSPPVRLEPAFEQASGAMSSFKDQRALVQSLIRRVQDPKAAEFDRKNAASALIALAQSGKAGLQEAADAIGNAAKSEHNSLLAWDFIAKLAELGSSKKVDPAPVIHNLAGILKIPFTQERGYGYQSHAVAALTTVMAEGKGDPEEISKIILPWFDAAPTGLKFSAIKHLGALGLRMKSAGNPAARALARFVETKNTMDEGFHYRDGAALMLVELVNSKHADYDAILEVFGRVAVRSDDPYSGSIARRISQLKP